MFPRRRSARVIGGYGSVSQATREKVEKIIKDVGYMPNAIAQSMKRKNTNTIGVVLGQYWKPLFWRGRAEY